jgi:hypothetical protein
MTPPHSIQGKLNPGGKSPPTSFNPQNQTNELPAELATRAGNEKQLQASTDKKNVTQD